jgi:magnesium chelatase accessory protein
VAAGGFRLHTQIVGSGPTLLLLHGTGAGCFSFAPLIERLKRGYRCITLDLPGHAFTTHSAEQASPALTLPRVAEVVRLLLTALELAPIGIIGHSAGAAIGWELLRTANDPRLRMLGVNAALVPPPRAYDWLGQWWMAPIATNDVVARALSAMARRPGTISATLRRTGSPVPDGLARCYAACAAMPAHVQGAMSLMAAWELRPLLAQLRGRTWPVHLMHGANDPWVPVAQLRSALANIDGVTLDVEPGGHLLHEEQPDLIASRVRAVWRIGG